MYIVQLLCVACFCRVSFGLAGEPKCYSKFDWEDKLLEKTIKTELMMQGYVKDMNIAMESVAGLKDQFKDLKVNLDTAVGNYRAVIAQEIAGMKDEFKEMRANLDTAIGEYRVAIGQQDQLIADSFKQPTIAFNVRDAKDLSPQAQGIIQFKTILLNVGGGYDEATGIFTSPVHGTFMFSIQVATYYQKWGRFQLVCDTSTNVILSITHYNSATSLTTTSGTVTHVLTQGQRVWLQFQYDAGSTSVLDEHANYASNQFSGVLVHLNTT